MVRNIIVLLQYMDPLFLSIRMNEKEECLDLEQIYFTQEIGKSIGVKSGELSI